MNIQPASGEQHAIRAGQYEAVIASVGATLRSFTSCGRHLIRSFDADEVRPAMRGALLAPWPNRTADGRYRFEGNEQQLVVNEPETATASHGLIAWLAFTLVDRSSSALHLRSMIEPQPGYPWRVRIDAKFDVGERGLSQELMATNLSANVAPIGLGGHPYLSAGAPTRDAVDSWSLKLPADEVILTSRRRALPTRKVTVGNGTGQYDFRGGRRLGQTVLNNAFGSLRRGRDGAAHVVLTGPAGNVTLSVDESCKWLQIYTADFGPPEARRSSLAVEPMTCPPNALNSRVDLQVLPPGGTTSLRWAIHDGEPTTEHDLLTVPMP